MSIISVVIALVSYLPFLTFMYLVITTKNGALCGAIGFTIAAVVSLVVILAGVILWNVVYGGEHKQQTQSFYMSACGCSEQCKIESPGARAYCP